ncbi:4'-phosphopantetheinyl transferase family protein [Rhodohalobacter halophilus]|uniref:4'-phosphopantetheinyl transferase family protein n=1 Tax=Rhodohalobacter halophilus TaxID=1812810 RepID=UPI0015B7247B|nr:4'-phosphopantetheinyl transferase superfamily protein [Rhodohalobacter halophilus]
MRKKESDLPERIKHSSIPGEIIVAYEPLVIETTGGDMDTSESITGTLLLKKMADKYLNGTTIDVYATKNEKPKAYIDGQEVSVSFSHTDHAIVAAISRTLNVGVDMESVNRKVHERLSKRMLAPNEGNGLYHENPLIQIWTFKEAALKMIGTGLRKPMNHVSVSNEDENLFNAEFDDGKKAKICSFQHQEHWISICYEKLP